ncbi:MAG: ABC transporter substrate-binding protein [Bacteroidota bacterium]|nr:ABC transporter substrate-binding protein [Bacteroidota bacterium]
MKTGKTILALLVSFMVLSACSKTAVTAGSTSANNSNNGNDSTVVTDTITIVSTPNPNIFPLLLALADNPSLKVKIIPVSDGSGLTSNLISGAADGMTSMSYIAAKQVTDNKVPDLQIRSVVYWSGFYEIAKPTVSSFNDLLGKHLIISGPVGNGKNGGPDIIFRAAMKRLNINPDTDFQLEYLPLADGVNKISNQQADAILLAEPAGTGLVLSNMMNMNRLSKAINLQSIFTGYTQWDANIMPVGGLSFKNSSLTGVGKKNTFDAMKTLYEQKAVQIMNGDINDAQKIADMFNALFGNVLPQTLPAQIIVTGVKTGSLVYKNNYSVPAIQSDLDKWIVELLGTSPGSNFYSN